MGTPITPSAHPRTHVGISHSVTTLVYLAFCLTGVAAGLWPDAIYPQPAGRPAPLPTLHTLAFAQATFFLLAYPVLILRQRARRGEGRLRLLGDLLESCLLLLMTVPFYVAAAYLGDATPRDGLRVVLVVAAFWPAAWAAGRLLAYRAVRPWVLLTLVGAVLGLPAVWYICRDFLCVSGDWAWALSPVTLAWSAAQARGASVLPHPLWAWLVWPIAGFAGLLLSCGQTSDA